MKKLAATLLTFSMVLSLSVSGCRKSVSSETRHRRTTASSEEADLPEAPQVEYNGSETAIFQIDPATAAGPSATEDELRIAYTRFIFDVVKRCAEKAGSQGILLSPDSVLFALEMTAAGASGDTLDQMLQTTMPGVGNADGFQFAVDRMNRLQSKSLSIANSVWINEADASSVYSDYMDYVTRHFDAGISILPFDDNVVDVINKWVEEKTNGMIPDLLDPSNIDPNTFMVLINAITFESEWATKYDEDQVNNGTFYLGNGNTQEATFLTSTENTYLRSGNASGFVKPYKDAKYGFVAILPDDETVDINSFVASMTAEEYWELWDSRASCEVDVMFPEFSSDYKIELPEVLQDMGMVAPFDENAADFSRMSSAPAYISNVIHQTHIDVDRQGTKAAAATAVTMDKATAVRIDNFVYCNRPFVYAIVDMDTGIPVFLGTCTNV